MISTGPTQLDLSGVIFFGMDLEWLRSNTSVYSVANPSSTDRRGLGTKPNEELRIKTLKLDSSLGFQPYRAGASSMRNFLDVSNASNGLGKFALSRTSGGFALQLSPVGRASLPRIVTSPLDIPLSNA